MKRLTLAASVALALAGCNDHYASTGRSLSPIPQQTVALMSEKGMSKSDPILVRLYKKESELEVWKKGLDGEYAKLKSYPICRWSGQLGPKRKEGDRQAPEGFYTVTPGQMNPNSSYYLSFDTGYPNAYDKAQGGTGSLLMVHGSCSSRGCYAMTDEGISEVYALAREAFSAGQKGFQFQAYPFRMTAENLAKFRHDPNMPFWRNLKEGSDAFEITKRETKVAVCNNRYAFNTVGTDCTADPTLTAAVREKDASDRHEVAELIAKGIPAVRLVYADGGQHEAFRQTSFAAFGGNGDSGFAILDSRARRNLGDVSRPDALAQGPQEVPMDEPAAAKGRATATLLAAARSGALRTAAASGPRVSESDGRTALASAPSAPIPSTKPDGEAEARPFYERMLGNVFGRGEPASAEASPVETAAVLDSAVPLPPRRHSAAAPSRAAAPAPKPQAAAPIPRRQVDAAQAGRPGYVAALAVN